MKTGGGHREPAGGRWLTVDIKPDGVRLEGVEVLDSIGARLAHVDDVIAPLAVLGPTDVELIESRTDQVGVVQIGPILHKGNVHTFIFAELPEVRAGMG